MGTVARTVIPGTIIGNTAETVLDNVACSVLAVKPPSWASAVRVTESANGGRDDAVALPAKAGQTHLDRAPWLV